MELSIEVLKQSLGEAFDLGYNNSHEFKNDLIEELLSNLQINSEEQYRIFKCAELKAMPEGTIFNHSTRGRCWIIVRPDGNKAMQFQKSTGANCIGIIVDGEPWDRPMRILHSEKSI